MESSEHYANLEVGYLFSTAWEIFKENLGLVFGIAIVQMLVVSISGIIPILPILIAGPMAAGAYHAMVRVVRGEFVEVRDVFDGFKQFGRSLGVYLGMALVIGVGLILLIVPGIVLAIGLFPAMFLVLDTEYGVGDTLQEAWNMTKGYKGQLFILFLAICGIVLLGLLAFIIGALVAGVFAYVVAAVAYDELSRGML